MLSELFSRHPASVGETYTEHMQVAAGWHGLQCVVYQVQQDLFHLVTVDRNPGKVLVQRNLQINAVRVYQVAR